MNRDDIVKTIKQFDGNNSLERIAKENINNNVIYQSIELTGVLTERERDYNVLRKKWSRWVCIWIGVSLLFQIVIVVLVGLGILKFSEYRWFIAIVCSENFLQILGLGFIVVKYLFPQNPKS